MRINAEAGFYWSRILEAFGYACAYCGEKKPSLCQEHMTPRCRGGGDEIENIVPSCNSCNSRKGRLTPLEWLLVQQDTHKWSSKAGHLLTREPRWGATLTCSICESALSGDGERVYTVCIPCAEEGWSTVTETMTLERLTAMWEELRAIPHTAFIVSRNVEPHRIIRVPMYYDKRLCREVRTVLIGEKAWQRLLAEFPVVQSPNGVPSPIAGIEIRFSPPDWRPQDRAQATRVPSTER